MIDQLIIGDLGSFDDFGASLAKRKIGQPKKKTIKETVPYSNITYDFSAINGELYWEERELEYIFEMTAQTPEELEEMKAAFSGWVMQVMDGDIHDPFISDYHFKGTFNEIEYEDDDDIEKTTITVKFTAYPYKLSNVPKKYLFTVAAGATIDATIINNSAHKVVPTLTASADVVIKFGNASYAIGAGTVKDGVLAFPVGITEIQIQNPNASECTLDITFIEEIL